MHIFYYESRQLPNTCSLLLTSDQHNNNVVLSATGNKVSQEEASWTHHYHMKTGGKKGPQSTYKTHSTTNIHTHWCQHAEDIQRPKVFLFFVIYFFFTCVPFWTATDHFHKVWWSSTVCFWWLIVGPISRWAQSASKWWL